MSLYSLNFTNNLNKIILNKTVLNKSVLNKSVLNKPLLNNPVLNKGALNKPLLNKGALNKPALNNPVLNKGALNKPLLNKPLLNKGALNKPLLNNYVFNKSNLTFDKNKIFYVCSSGGCGSTILFNYLKNFGTVYHIHDRYPPNKLEYIGKENTDKAVYSEWINGIQIPEENLKNYKVIFIYRHPIQVIYSRFSHRNGPNLAHLQHIKCDNSGNINIFDVLNSGKDLYKIEEFFDSYTIPTERNYNIYCVKYELFWDNISLFNQVMKIPDIKGLYPIKHERPKQLQFLVELTAIYNSLINKMKSMRFIEIVQPIKKEYKI